MPSQAAAGAGHVGFLGRSGVFLFVAILMFRTIKTPDINNTDETTIGNALSQLQKTHGGRAGLFILGFFLLVYGIFAVSRRASTPVRKAYSWMSAWLLLSCYYHNGIFSMLI